MKINAVKCSKCGDTIFSRARHDMRECSCGSLSIDGGFDYCKVNFNPDVPHESVTLDLDIEKKELYNDYNFGIDNFGLIGPNK